MGARAPRQLIDFLHGYDPGVRSLALRLRTIVIDELAPCHEYIFWMRSKVVLLYGSSERVIDDNICSIGVFSRHVDLAFKRGVDLDDRDGVLEGAGKGMRHIKVMTVTDLNRPEIPRFLRKARRDAGLKPARRGLVTRVKPRAASKPEKRPRLF